MKHEILEEVWRVRDEISAECGHDLKKLAAVLAAKKQITATAWHGYRFDAGRKQKNVENRSRDTLLLGSPTLSHD